MEVSRTCPFTLESAILFLALFCVLQLAHIQRGECKGSSEATVHSYSIVQPSKQVVGDTFCHTCGPSDWSESSKSPLEHLLAVFDSCLLGWLVNIFQVEEEEKQRDQRKRYAKIFNKATLTDDI